MLLSEYIETDRKLWKKSEPIGDQVEIQEDKWAINENKGEEVREFGEK